MRALTVGLMADPGLPETVARAVARDLARELGRVVDADARWNVEVSRETLPLTREGDIPLLEHAAVLRNRRGWDVVVYLTDLLRSHDGDPMLCEVSSEAGAALVSLPALGVARLRGRVRALLVTLIRAVLDGTRDHPSEDAVGRSVGRHGLRRVPPAGSEDASYIVLPGAPNRVRLLSGMVRSNRPGRLLPALSSSIAAAAATGAFGIFYATIWSMADALSTIRLATISAVVVSALSTWLIVHSGLWNRPRRAPDRRRARLDNAATVITVWLSVALMYLVLWAGLFAVGVAVVDAGYLHSQLGRPVSLLDYVRLSWLAASLGTLAGALGSNFDSDEAIREATYSKREHQRRQLADSYED